MVFTTPLPKIYRISKTSCSSTNNTCTPFFSSSSTMEPRTTKTSQSNSSTKPLASSLSAAMSPSQTSPTSSSRQWPIAAVKSTSATNSLSTRMRKAGKGTMCSACSTPSFSWGLQCGISTSSTMRLKGAEFGRRLSWCSPSSTPL